MRRPVALVRAVPDSFVSCVTSRPVSPPLYPDRAREQHAGYVAALEAGGFAVFGVPADESHPDCSFIEDAAVVVGRRALLTNPGHPSRRGEGRGVGAVLSGWVAVEEMEAGTLDGGDVLQAGGRVFAGLSARSDATGVAMLARFCDPIEVVPVPVRDTLHLKSGVSALDEETVLWHPAACSREVFTGLRVIEVPGADPEAANVVRLPDGSILVAAHQVVTADLVAAMGYPVRPVDVSEFARADGGLTCLSLRLRSVSVVSSTA
ncbi:MAG: dimethylargininase [Acidimicrobiia bacterium]|nr:dimethylargininase [Acidimicrobiia bacterium]